MIALNKYLSTAAAYTLCRFAESCPAMVLRASDENRGATALLALAVAFLAMLVAALILMTAFVPPMLEKNTEYEN